MLLSKSLCGAAVAAPVLAIAASSSAVVITNNAVATEAAAIGSLVALDLSSIVTGLTTTNTLSSIFNAPGGSYSGTLTASVYANVSTPGSALTTTLIIYSFSGNGPSAIDQFSMGRDSNSNLDFADLASATQGSIGDLTSIGQGSPVVELIDNSALPTNDLFNFNFLPGGDPLGGPGSTELFGWYIQTTGAVSINVIDVLVTDFGGVTTQTLGLVKIPGQPDLNVPAPGSAMFLIGMVGIASRRRR